MIPARGLLLVRPIETDETAPGSAIILIADTRERMTAAQCEVIAVGAPAECNPMRSCAERKCERAHRFDLCTEYPYGLGRLGLGCQIRVHPNPARVGDWLLVRPRAYIEGPEPERKEWFVHQDDVMAILSAEEAT